MLLTLHPSSEVLSSQRSLYPSGQMFSETMGESIGKWLGLGAQVCDWCC